MERGIDRRTFLQLAGAGLAGAALDAEAARAKRPRAAPHAPNVLVVVIDSLRYDYVGANGNPWIRTPNIDALARESLRFTRAFPEAMPTVPARRSLLTGRRVYPWTHWRPTRNLPGSPGWTGLASSETTWLETLRAAGYWTGYVTDNPFLGFDPSWKSLRTGVDRFVPIDGRVGARRPASTISLATVRHWLPADLRDDQRYVAGMRQHLANLHGDHDEHEQGCARVFSHGADELTRASARGPFALVVDCFDPHEPWVPVQRYLDLYGPRHYREPEPGNVRYRPARYLTAAERTRLPQLYAAAVTQTDAWLGHLLQRFHERGLADDTIVVLLSDHGIVLGERGWTGKPALELHPELIQVPFLLRAPDGRGAGQTTPYFASPHDVGPTVLSMAGVRAPATMNGVDLAPLLDARAPSVARPFWYGGYANHWYYRDDDWAMIADGRDRGRELFDLHGDPRELHDIARSHPRLIGQIHERVLKAAGVTRLPYFGRR
jgi:arylsulfatase A-like enzyme